MLRTFVKFLKNLSGYLHVSRKKHPSQDKLRMEIQNSSNIIKA